MEQKMVMILILLMQLHQVLIFRIASGGAGKLEHLRDVIKLAGADAVLVASIFHYGEYTIRQAKEYLRSEGINMRL